MPVQLVAPFAVDQAPDSFQPLAGSRRRSKGASRWVLKLAQEVPAASRKRPGGSRQLFLNGFQALSAPPDKTCLSSGCGLLSGFQRNGPGERRAPRASSFSFCHQDQTSSTPRSKAWTASCRALSAPGSLWPAPRSSRWAEPPRVRTQPNAFQCSLPCSRKSQRISTAVGGQGPSGESLGEEPDRDPHQPSSRPSSETCWEKLRCARH